MIKIKPAISPFILIPLFLLAFTAACQTPPEPTEIVAAAPGESSPGADMQVLPTDDPYEFAESDPGFITLHGLLVVRDPTSMLPAPDDAIYLVPMADGSQGVTGIPQFEAGEVPQADVDERTGEFVFVNIEPGKYAIVAVTMGGAQIPTRKMEDGAYSIMEFSAEQVDQIVELGSLSLP